MKCKRLLALALAAALCIVAAACGTKNNEPDTPAKTDTPTAAPGGTQTVGDTGDGTVREDGSYVPGQVDRLRLTYNGNVSSALYVTSAAQLPDYPELSAYDDAFFKDHALVLVQESVQLRLRGGGHRVRVPEGGPRRRGGADPSGPRRGAGWHRRHGHMAAVDGGGHRTGGLPVDGGQSGAGVPAVSVLIKRFPTPVCHADGGFSAHFPAVPTGKCGGDSV